MKILKINLEKITEEQIDLITKYFQAGKIVAYPTDTVYGLGCLAFHKKALQKIYQIKNITATKPLLVLMKDKELLKQYCEISSKQENYLTKIWYNKDIKHKPTTIIFDIKKILTKKLDYNYPSLAVRIVNNFNPKNNLPEITFLSKILVRVNKPIISTSLNITGKPTLDNLKNIENYFSNIKPDLVIDTGNIDRKKASKIIDLRDIENIKIIRE